MVWFPSDAAALEQGTLAELKGVRTYDELVNELVTLRLRNDGNLEARIFPAPRAAWRNRSTCSRLGRSSAPSTVDNFSFNLITPLLSRRDTMRKWRQPGVLSFQVGKVVCNLHTAGLAALQLSNSETPPPLPTHCSQYSAGRGAGVPGPKISSIHCPPVRSAV